MSDAFGWTARSQPSKVGMQVGSRRTVVLSPHLDDAVISCWHVLEGDDDVTVVNVFTGLPEPGTLGWWDSLTGAADSAERVRERLREDAEALGKAGARSVELDLLDAQYRRNGGPPALAEPLSEHVREAATVYAPAALGWHPDHKLVRAAALEQRPDTRLYADVPHANEYGWPQWVTGSEPSPGLDVESGWRVRFAEVGIDAAQLSPRVHTLDDEAFQRKLTAVRAYRTQLAALERDAPLDSYRWEVEWTR
jgi:LmbE family N-acetylglucosaminyl deacetylase